MRGNAFSLQLIELVRIYVDDELPSEKHSSPALSLNTLTILLDCQDQTERRKTEYFIFIYISSREMIKITIPKRECS